MSEACTRDKRYIEELERELQNCSLEIGYLQDQLSLRKVESNCIGEHVHCLELKLADVGSLQEKLRLLSEALMKSESRRLSLMQEIKDKEEELHNSSLRIEELETSISSIALESQCEIESMKLEISELEERCFEAERLGQQAAHEKGKMELLLEMSQSQLQEAEERINILEMENKDLKQQVVVYETNADRLYCKVMEHLDTWMKHYNRMKFQGNAASFWDLLVKLKKELPSLKALDDNGKVEMEKMASQILELELQVVQLKEELNTEKMRAKEEAEDLTQEMAELRYKMTEMLEEECKRRASIEQASLRRIQDLEEQVRKERNNCLTAIRRFQDVFKLAEMQDKEVRYLKNALEGFRKIMDPETARKIESCNHEDLIISDNLYKYSTADGVGAEDIDDSCDGHTSHRALLEWYPDDKPPSTEAEKQEI